MRLPASRRRARALPATVLAVLLGAPAASAPPATATGAAVPAQDLRTRVAAAVEAVRQDPNLGAERSVRTLHWIDRQHAPASSAPFLRRLAHWIAEGLRWIAAAGRAAIIAAVLVLAALLAVYLLRSAARRRRFAPPAREEPPAFVRGLDIRPASLPDDVGAAALALWTAGATRAALALLYRGLLSRAAHVHRVPIRDASTEGDCLRLCAGRCTAATQDYALRLVRTWELAVYRGQLPGESQVVALCADFAAALAPAAPAAAGAPHTTAVPA